MNSLFKRSAIGLVVLGITGSAFAYHHGNANQGGGMWMPNVNGAFIGAEGLYLRPQNGDLDFVTVSGLTTIPGVFTKNISTDYQWDWRVYAGIKFTDNDDITLSWLHFDQNYSSDVFNPTPGTVSVFAPRLLDAVNGAVGASVKFDLDEAYGVWGHTVHFNNPWSLRWAAGVEYARLSADLDVAATHVDTVVANNNTLFLAEGESSFNGWGPRLELDVSYGLPCGLGWFLRTNAVLLSAQRDVSLEAFHSVGPIESTLASADWSDRNVIIPKFGMKIGLDYSYFWGQAGSEGACGTTLTAEIGWQADVYIHAIERPVSSFTTGNEVLSSFASTKVSNFSDQGMFIGLKVGTDWM